MKIRPRLKQRLKSSRLKQHLKSAACVLKIKKTLTKSFFFFNRLVSDQFHLQLKPCLHVA